jgi:hypothetical protein
MRARPSLPTKTPSEGTARYEKKMKKNEQKNASARVIFYIYKGSVKGSARDERKIKPLLRGFRGLVSKPLYTD